ncbi:serine/threonine-protein kinase [uncultured Deinococcus sp.]|uniref:serine/threonine-protein kinase n=1 Tax=uncultured Deinococcus sp. TaxID=158789 RepID=UPI0025884CA4|nr:serine/threonine-protein kinase [uncultured Deinococcus sp.]
MTHLDRTPPGYRLLRLLGQGKTSQVHLALGDRGQEVALKLPHPATLGEQEAAERFGNEVRLTLKFRHPHIVRGYAGTAFGPQAYLALRYYPGGPLSETLLLAPQALGWEARLRVLADLASALTYLHALGAVHQDVKPQNVYLDPAGRAALGDLGSSYFVAQGGPVSGSPFYMAPEIYHGEASSSASDVYSLGILSYELLSGLRPFLGQSYEELMVAHLTRFPQPLSQVAPELPRAAARLIERAFAKRASDRPGADELRRALLLALGETPGDEQVEEEPAAPSAPAAPTGRHAAPGRAAQAPAPAFAPTEPPTPEPSGDAATPRPDRWRLFRRRK